MTFKQKRFPYFLGAAFLLFLILLIPSYLSFGAYSWLFLLLGLVSFSLLYGAFLLAGKFAKDRKAKSHKWAFLTNLSARCADKGRRLDLCLRLSSLLLLALFFARFYFYRSEFSITNEGGFSYWTNYYDCLHLQSLLVSKGFTEGLPLSKTEQAIGTLCNDLWTGLVIFSLVSAFYLDDFAVPLKRFLFAPLAFTLTALSPFLLKGITGGALDYRTILLGLELGVMDFYYLHSYLEKGEWKLSKKQVRSLLLVMLPFLISSLGAFTPSLLFGRTVFGLGNPQKPTQLSHRILLYLAFVLPVVYFVSISPLSEKNRRGILLQISLGTLLGYVSVNRANIWTDLSSWPLHLCNTAMYTMPLALLRKNYGVFYFTVFINVLGAFFALMMPNYSSTIGFLDPDIIQFYINHLHAFFMPVLILLLGVYKRPNIKYFLISQAGFFLYFCLVLFADVYLTGQGKSADFFFINSSFIADKLGQWAQNLFAMEVKFTVGEHTYVIHLIYDVLYYLIYVAMAGAMWFGYELLFRLFDEFRSISKNKQKALERKERFQGGKDMDHQNASIEIKGLYKKYRGNDAYSVEDFSLSIEKGEICGFLGKNGAGKSTIIKSIVGIHGFDEGQIEVCGYDVSENPLEAKREIGFVPDNYALYENLTGRQYVRYIADLFKVSKEDRQKREEDLVKRLELNLRYDKPIKTYSHGMKQKVTIIAALIHDPKIWILDEPMTGLDPNSIFQIKECMREHAKKGNIVFFSSHIIDVVKNLCDEVVIIKRGRLVTRIDLNEKPEERETLEETFLSLTSDTEEERQTLLAEERKEAHA